MKIEAGKFYKTLDGRKAYICGANPLGGKSVEGALCGFIEHDGSKLYWWELDGSEFSDKMTRIIHEWKEPAKGTVWVNVYEDKGSVYAYDNKYDADRMASGARIACIEVSWTEGQGL